MGPTNADIIAMLGKIDLKLNDMDARFKVLEGLERKMDNFEKELKKTRFPGEKSTGWKIK
ncbi:hypothetical protein DPMN_036010 [Dreissena polymorpha]|uniref:Uncharacterized protein n=1 Tax=Dreissena polymorpha TaxID=45954 RepID=A0A9D4MC56_DREPO|nr:hypothetical protein DPMN_036010 [Dreissena polymorpha]